MEDKNQSGSELKEGKNKQKIFKITSDGKERTINIFLVKEMIRFWFYVYFTFILALGFIITALFAEEGYKNAVPLLSGSVNLCIYLDFPPAIYVLPGFYAVWPIIVFLFVVASIFRAWISKMESKISGLSLRLYTFALVYFLLAVLNVAITFAIQPDLKNLPESWIIHTLPFTNLILAVLLLQIAMTWFNVQVAWVDLKEAKWLEYLNYFILAIIVLTSVIKITQHINTFGCLKLGEGGKVLDNGWMWSVNSKIIGQVCQVADIIWVIFALVIPMCQSGYMSLRICDQTHALRITIEDNRNAKLV